MKAPHTPHQRSSFPCRMLCAAIAGFTLFAAAPARSQTTLLGDHIIDGSLDVLGSTFGLSSLGDDPNQPGFSLSGSGFDWFVPWDPETFWPGVRFVMQSTNATQGTEYVWRDHDGADLMTISSLNEGPGNTLQSVNVFLPMYANAGLSVEGVPVMTAASLGAIPDNIYFPGGGSRVIGVNPSTNAAGGLLSISAGAGAGSNKSGGHLTLSSGASTGTQTSSISLKTAPPGTSGSGVNLPQTRMTITGAGNVGIGTTSPSARLHVVGQVIAGDGLTGTTLSQVVVGKHNDSAIDNSTGTPNDRSEGVFIVGAGSGATGQPIPAVQNAMRILPDGTVLILPKGDLQMDADFQQGPRP